MSDRITERHLQGLVDRLNKISGTPLTTYTKTKDKYIANIGNYHIDHAYGGVELQQICNLSGGVTDVLGTGHVTKRDLYNQIHAFIRGLDTGKENEI